MGEFFSSLNLFYVIIVLGDKMIYTLGFIRYKDEMLLINRVKQPWKGCWNGVGGKIESNEAIYEAILREVKEETGIELTKQDIYYKGKMTWEPNDGSFLYIFLMDVNEKIKTPIVTNEGILDWRKIDWIVDQNNLGVAHNIPYFLPDVLSDTLYDYHCIFEGNQLIAVNKQKVEDTHV
jgi:8-oxo-dGTP diphosphatase